MVLAAPRKWNLFRLPPATERLPDDKLVYSAIPLQTTEKMVQYDQAPHVVCQKKENKWRLFHSPMAKLFS